MRRRCYTSLTDLLGRWRHKPKLITRHDKHVGIPSSTNRASQGGSTKLICFIEKVEQRHPSRCNMNFSKLQKPENPKNRKKSILIPERFRLTTLHTMLHKDAKCNMHYRGTMKATVLHYSRCYIILQFFMRLGLPCNIFTVFYTAWVTV